MPRHKNLSLKWQGEEVQCYYDIPSPGANRKYYNSFIKNGISYDIGEYAIFSTYSTHNGNKLDKIGVLKCFFEEEGEFKAVVVIYKRAIEFRNCFLSLSIDYDDSNEVVLDSSEEKIIFLKNISRKCRVILGHKDNTVTEVIDNRNLNRKIYYLCRYRYTQNGDLVPLFNDEIKNDITIEEIKSKNKSSLETPSRQIMSANKSIGAKKNYSVEPTEDDDVKNQIPQLSQVRRNLNNSFNDSLSQDEKSYLNYSIVEKDDENLKIKLRVSNGKILSKIPSSQPLVLLNKIESTPPKQNDVIYELKSPSFQRILKKSEEKPLLRTPEKVLNEMVENMKLRDKTPVKLSPRKLRRLERPLYKENYSDTDSEEFTGRRRVATNKGVNLDNPVGVRRSTRVRKSGLNQDFEYLVEFSDSKKNNSLKKRKLEQTSKNSVNEMNDSDDEVMELTNKNKRKTERNTISMSSTKSTRAIHETSDEDCSKRISGSINSNKNEVENSALITPSTKLARNFRSLSIRTPRGTPKTPRTAKGTPLKMIRNGTLTPSVDPRLKVVEKSFTPLLLARNTLHVSYVPKILPCREKEYKDIYNFIEGKLRDKCGGCMYISGVPGTGKTATVTAAIDNITKTLKIEGSADFNYVCINGMKVTEPRQCYVEILKQLTGKRVPWEQALTILEKQFTTKSAKKVIPTVLLIDELDILCTKRQDVVYNLLDWPTKTNAQLIVVTIANTMDLPERLLMSRVTSRLGLTRLTFQAYTHKQLQEIVINRLAGNESFRADAVQFVARKVASVSGDARRALDICRRSAEIAELEGPNTQVSMKHVNDALEAMITQPKVKAILHCSKLEKLLLRAVIAEVERTGLEETVFEDVYTTLNSLATLEGFKMVSPSLVTGAVHKLTSCRLLLSDQNCNGLDQRILLNVSSDDVYYALKKD